MTPRTRTSVRIDREVYDGVSAYATENHASITWAINALLRKALTAVAREHKTK